MLYILGVETHELGDWVTVYLILELANHLLVFCAVVLVVFWVVIHGFHVCVYLLCLHLVKLTIGVGILELCFFSVYILVLVVPEVIRADLR